MPRTLALALVLGAGELVCVHAAPLLAVEDEPMHRLVYRNDRVAVLDVLIPPHATTQLHTHRHDLAGFTVTSSPTREAPLGGNATNEPASPENEAWFEPFPAPSTHRVTNLGDRPVRYLMFDLLHDARPGGEKAIAAAIDSAGTTVIENSRVRVLHFRIAPGAMAPEHGHASAYGLVLATGGTIAIDERAPRTFPNAGFVSWNDDTAVLHRLRNAGDQPVDVLEFEFPP